MRTIFVRLTIVLAVLMLLFAACAPAATPTTAPEEPMEEEPTEAPPPTEAPAMEEEEETEEATEVPEEEAGPSGTLYVAHGEKLESIDPHARLQIHSYNIALMIYDSLVDVDDAGVIHPRLATDWELVDENTWKFTLRDDVVFHNGEPFTSESVKFTLDRIVAEETQSAQAGVWANYDTVDTSDPYVALIKTKEPMGTILTNLALTAMVPPEAGQTMDFATEAIGTGPYKFVEWVLDDQLTLEANMDYWGEKSKVERVVEKWIPENTTRMSALETGEIHLVWGVPPEERARLEDAPDVTVVEAPTYTVRFLWMNGGREPFDQEEVRDAVRYAIDIDAIIEELFDGQGVRATGCVAQGVYGYCEQEPYPYDPERARELLAEAGLENGFSTTMKVPTYLPKQKEMAEVIAAYLAEIGIEVQVEIQDQGLWIEDLLALNWDMNLLGTGTITGDADFTLRRIYQTDAERTGYYDDELNRLLVEQQSVLDQEERLDMLCQACNILWDEGPTVWLFATTWVYAYQDNVQGFEPRLNQFIYYNEISLDEE